MLLDPQNRGPVSLLEFLLDEANYQFQVIPLEPIFFKCSDKNLHISATLTKVPRQKRRGTINLSDIWLLQQHLTEILLAAFEHNAVP